MELAKNFAFEFSVLGSDYVVYQNEANAMFQGQTRIYEADDGGETPLIEFTGAMDKAFCEAAILGFRLGLAQGEEIGAAGVKRALRQLLDLPSLQDVQAMDGRMERMEAKVGRMNAMSTVFGGAG